MKAAVVVTTYNNPKFLGICLKSFSNQSCLDFDLFIADDGSKEDTRAKIEALRSQLPCRIQHVWHPDSGYKKSAINNEVFRRVGPDYPVLILVDHDTVAHHRFVEDHLSVHRDSPRTVLMGRRVELGQDVTDAIDERNVCSFNRGVSTALIRSALLGRTRGLSRAFRVSAAPMQTLLRRNQVPDLLGSNFSISRDLLLEVNGYNEDYQAYWGEDGDLFVRLRNSGAKLVGLKSFAIQFHLSHPRLDPKREHQQRYQDLLKDRTYTRCRNGIVRE